MMSAVPIPNSIIRFFHLLSRLPSHMPMASLKAATDFKEKFQQENPRRQAKGYNIFLQLVPG
jgi:hypothetical protein